MTPALSKVDRLRVAAAVSPSVRRAREAEVWEDEIATALSREQKRRAKGQGRSADEALAAAERIVAMLDEKASKRVVHTHSGKTASLAALRETALKRLEVEFGEAAPIHVRCVYCGALFFVKAGTVPQVMPKTCKRGCKCACGRRTSRASATRAARAGRAAHCVECGKATRAAHASTIKASMSPEARRVSARKALQKMDPTRMVAALMRQTAEQRRANSIKANASMTAEQRSNAKRKANAALTPLQRSEIKRHVAASRTAEERSASARKAHAVMTPEQRANRAAKISATQRANAAAKAAKEPSP